MAGNALANATAAAPISRTDADRLLKEFLIRVGIVNGDKPWLYRVGKVVIFGSYLNSQDCVGDIDLAIRLDQRTEFAECWPEALLARAETPRRTWAAVFADSSSGWLGRKPRSGVTFAGCATVEFARLDEGRASAAARFP